jgi:long-chain fatty acid transport protein
MKRIISLGLVIIVFASVALAGGIVTNTNQSAEFIRTLNRNASTCVDAAYFNPAGLTKLSDGIYFSFSNQSVFQTEEVVNNFALLNDDTFTGDVAAPLFPDVHVAYKKDKLAVGASFMPIGGGGSATYESGLPSFEIPVSVLTAPSAEGGLQELGVTGYQLDTKFDGSSVYFAGQVGAAYAINDMISVAVGGRYVMANNAYQGHLKDIEVTADGSTYAAPGDYVRGLIPYYPDAMEMFLTMTALALDVATADAEVDAKQTGSGFTAIIGANLAPMDGLNVGIRYEHLTALELTNDTEVDDTGMFKHDSSFSHDMPAMLALGVSYKIMPQLKAEASFNYYMNTGVDWGGAEDNLENGFEGGAAFEYKISDALRASVGFLYSQGGATEDYQSDLDFSLNSSTVGFGVAYALNPNLEFNVGAANTFYTEGNNVAGGLYGDETYNKTSIDFAVGIKYKL